MKYMGKNSKGKIEENLSKSKEFEISSYTVRTLCDLSVMALEIRL